tara:strand:- start:530 stop:787 length:258 start_codon:yes stop_codon:yes gene_type:complete
MTTKIKTNEMLVKERRIQMVKIEIEGFLNTTVPEYQASIITNRNWYSYKQIVKNHKRDIIQLEEWLKELEKLEKEVLDLKTKNNA